MNIQQIHLTTGVGDLTFTMSEQEIIERLGEPSHIDNDTLNDCLVYYYNDLDLAVVFVEIDGQKVIDSFEMENANYQLWQTPIFSQSFDTMVELFKQNPRSDFEQHSFEQHNNEYGCYIIYDNLFIEFDKETYTATDFSLSNPNL